MARRFLHRAASERETFTPATALGSYGFPIREADPSFGVGMKHKDMLVGTSLLSVLLLSFHFTQDALHARPGTQAAGAGNIVAALIVFVFLTGTALLAERRLGQIIMLLGALFAIGMPVLHFTNGADMNKHSGAFFFVWCLIALGVTGAFSIILLTLELPRVWRRARESGVAETQS